MQIQAKEMCSAGRIGHHVGERATVICKLTYDNSIRIEYALFCAAMICSHVEWRQHEYRSRYSDVPTNVGILLPRQLQQAAHVPAFNPPFAYSFIHSRSPCTRTSYTVHRTRYYFTITNYNSCGNLACYPVFLLSLPNSLALFTFPRCSNAPSFPAGFLRLHSFIYSADGTTVFSLWMRIG